MIYKILIEEHLDQRWETKFDGFTLTHLLTLDQQPFTMLTGEIADQAELYGILGHLRNLGVVLFSFQPQEPPEINNTITEI